MLWMAASIEKDPRAMLQDKFQILAVLDLLLMVSVMGLETSSDS